MKDVIAVRIDTRTVRIIASGRNEFSANAVLNLAVWRLGIEEEFFVVVDQGSYKDGDKWETEK